MEPMIGGDVEVFVRDGKTQALDSAILYIDGTKKVPQQTKNGAIQYDNIMAEFNITPAQSDITFIENTMGVLEDLRTWLNKHNKVIDISPWQDCPNQLLKHPMAQQLGCEPDMSVWALDTIHQVDAKAVGNFRSAGGHIHIGLNHIMNITPEQQLLAAKLCDLYLGIPSILMDSDNKRRRFYGKAGSFRPKPYGIEYRVLSNFWVQKVSFIEWAYHQAQSVAYFVMDNMNMIYDEDVNDIIKAINTYDKVTARRLVDKYGIEVGAYV